MELKAELNDMDNELEVRLYGNRVGTLTQTTKNRLVFTYDDAYASQSNAPPLSTSMPVRTAAYGPNRAEPWFEGLLAEGRRREHLARIAGAAGMDTWSLLKAAGAECAGAVQIVAREHADTPSLFHLDEERLAKLLRETPVEPLGSISKAARMSIAGAQDKVTLYRNSNATWAVPVAGHPSTHILKPQSRTFPNVVQNEHWCMEVARRAGLDTATTWVETIGGQEVLVIERYDRIRRRGDTIERVHQEDLAQALARQTKYQADGGPGTYELFNVPGVNREGMFDHLMFAWLVGNCDAHAKNYSILEPGTARARLAPVYDMVSTECYPLEDNLATSIGRERDLNRVDRKAVETLGRRIGFEPGEATERLYGLAKRTMNAVNDARNEGLTDGPIDTTRWEARIAKTSGWHTHRRSLHDTGRRPPSSAGPSSGEQAMAALEKLKREKREQTEQSGQRSTRSTNPNDYGWSR